MNDPIRDKNLAYHTGMHSKIQENNLRATNIAHVSSPMEEIDFTAEEELLIIPMCKSGIHRAPGLTEMLKRYFNTEVVHLGQGKFWKDKCQEDDKDTCGICNKISHIQRENDELPWNIYLPKKQGPQISPF